MSRTQQPQSNAVKNPATCYLEWSGEHGHFTYWDGQDRQIVEALDFVLIDSTKCVTGFDSNANSRLYSNNVRSTEDHMVVRVAKTNTVVAEGSYAEIKSDKWKYTENLLVLAEINGMAGIVQISLSGAGVQALVTLREEHSMSEIYNSLVRVTRSEKMKKGRVEYYQPTFTLLPLDDEMKTKADEFDVEFVIPYMKSLEDRQREYVDKQAAKETAEV
jgi:hypothetical protein